MKLFEDNYIGDNLDVMKTFPSGFFNQIITSPPYDGARTYKGFPPLTMRRIRDLAKEFYRILSDNGVLCWNVNDMSDGKGGESLNSLRQALIFQKVGFSVKTIIWEKTAFAFPQDNEYYRLHEYLFICHKGNFTFNPIIDVKVSGKSQKLGEHTKRKKDGSFVDEPHRTIELKNKEYEEFRKRGTVWKGNTAAQEYPCQKTYGHAPMPEWLVRDLMLSFSNPGDVILDPFSGGGTTWKIARELGRSIVTIEISEDIHREAVERVSHINPVMF